MLMSAPPPIVPALVVVFFAAGTAIGYMLVRRAILVRPYTAAAANPEVAADAGAQLDQIDATNPRPERYKQLAAAMRAYLDARLGMPTASLSGADLERALTRDGEPRPLARSVAQLIERCDAVASGASRLDARRLRLDIASARELLRALAR
jgi:hypothetical protein